jgi:hypothetical protein
MRASGFNEMTMFVFAIRHPRVRANIQAQSRRSKAR